MKFKRVVKWKEERSGRFGGTEENGMLTGTGKDLGMVITTSDSTLLVLRVSRP